MSIAALPNLRVGQGYDVHELVPGHQLVIGGVNIPFEKRLFGHSDADVLLHAVTDAVLGASALGDIGRYFPDTDPQFKGLSSVFLLKETMHRVRQAGYELLNLDCTVIAQAPKLSPYIDAMIVVIAGALDTLKTRVNVKAKTNEKLGYLGRQEAIEAQAVVLLVEMRSF
ncbi:2-C-methyl-D-erythritol 2,4-cyclodiphosphate synthase [Candidatus Pandoraea novymonadis]|uniref:2-C-methyl-D-erythritol 2,4-cyclodiphosphate synthase n=1 Tax=Candidatus Pandoraea novymonadis TaxID=1808959 RepID=A0ABX5FG10_9BURK|nr:2-C-methyl-D-erythritol 2,4-cyclodiphosphate synthase [Candidatus Pandoraea novymonadis]PSB92172.1 2-C-methyl-D-erythritol 2,4-cyclodiphosphate synthase [Candidatus Pandoraea novymonadis]